VGTALSRCLRFILLLLVPAALLSTAPALPAAAPAPALVGRVTWIYDADTLKIEPHGQVRLIGIDAPEKAASARDLAFTRQGIAAGRLRPVHDAGLAWSIHHIKGQPVTLLLDQTERDRHGRLLAYVRLADGRLLNHVLLEEGLAIVYRRFDFRLKAEFLAAETKARERGVGLWAH